MTLNKLINELQELKKKGYGEYETVIFEKMFSNENPYHTTIENIEPTKASWDKTQNVIVFMR